MSDNTTARTENWMLADDVLREVIGGETGERTRSHVEASIDLMRREQAQDPDTDLEQLAWECSDHSSGGFFPYTYDMAQAWAESIHHVTFEQDAEAGPFEDPFAWVCSQMSELVRQALILAGERIAEDLDEEDGE